MAFSLAKLVFLLSLSSFIFACVGQDTIQKICWKARNSDFCFQLYNPDFGKSVQDLAVKAITYAATSAVNTNTLINSLVKGTTDPPLKGKYESCSKNYFDVMTKLDEAAKSIRNFKAMNDNTFAALTAVDACAKGLGGSPVNPSKLNDGLEDMRNVCSILLVISTLS